MATCHFGLHRKGRQSSHASFPPQFRCTQKGTHMMRVTYVVRITFLTMLGIRGKALRYLSKLMPTAHKASPRRPGLDITRPQRQLAPTKHASSRMVEIHTPLQRPVSTRKVPPHPRARVLTLGRHHQGLYSPNPT